MKYISSHMRAKRAVLIMVRTLDGVYQPITDFTNFDNFFSIFLNRNMYLKII